MANDIKHVFELWASSDSFIEHSDYEKCGQCWKEKLRSDVAKDFLKEGRTSEKDLTPMYMEIDRRWRETSLFKEVSLLMESGFNIDQITDMMSAKGIAI